MKKLLLAAAAVALSSSPAFAVGNTDTTQGSATATIIGPLQILHDAGRVLSFGTFIGGTGGNIVVDPNGTLTSSVPIQATGSVISSDAFTVTGEPLRSFDISVLGGNVTGLNTGANIPFTTTASAASLALDASGNANFTVGGTLAVAGTELADVYSGSYDATVTYQ